MHLLLVDPGEGKATSIALKRALLTAPPAWLDGQRVALVTGSQDEPTTIVVDTANGKIAKGPAGERRLATSGDGSVIATSAGPGTPILLRSSRGWLADDGTSTGSVEVPDGFVDAISLALDRAGSSRDRVARRGRGAQVRRARRHGRLAKGLESAAPRGLGRRGRLAQIASGTPDASPAQEVGTGSTAEKIETCASSGSITPITFWSVRRWTHEPQLSK